jgi:cytochrome c6
MRSVIALRILSAAMTCLTLLLLTSPQLAAQGAETFKTKCAMCHGADGSGKTVMGEKLNLRDLRSPGVQKQSDADLTQIISKGKGKMTPFESKLSKEQIDQLVTHLRELGKKANSAPGQ